MNAKLVITIHLPGVLGKRSASPVLTPYEFEEKSPDGKKVLRKGFFKSYQRLEMPCVRRINIGPEVYREWMKAGGVEDFIKKIADGMPYEYSIID